MELPDSIPVVPGPSEDRLAERQLMDYEKHREQMLSWLYGFGKEPESAVGYSESTLKNTAYRLDHFYRSIWDRQGYPTNIGVPEADAFVRELAVSDESQSHKSTSIAALKRLFKWKVHEKGGQEWEPEFSFSRSNSATQPRDFLTKEERSAVREAALEYGSIPRYNDLTPEQRSRWKRHLAQRFGKPIEQVTPDDWDRANGWKVPSLVWTSLDCGLRPVEVERATVDWVDVENGLLRIPKEESSKNRDNWIVGLTERSTESLRRWLDQRTALSKYANSDQLWMTREANPYSSHALRYLINRLCEEAGIATDARQISWYSIRHSVGTYLTREEGLAAAQTQLRHKSEQTTMKYDQTPVEDRKDALERMG